LSQVPALPELRAINDAHGIAMATVTAVDIAACQVVNQMASLALWEPNVSNRTDPPCFRELKTMFATG